LIGQTAVARHLFQSAGFLISAPLVHIREGEREREREKKRAMLKKSLIEGRMAAT
jgi:hypothetical protein